MKKIILLLSLLFITSSAFGQLNDFVGAGISYNRAELLYQHNFNNLHFYTQFYAGIGNQDLNSDFDDIYCGLKIGKNLYSFTSSRFYSNASVGLYFTNNNYFSLTVPNIGINIGYQLDLSQSGSHSLFAECVYQYGAKEYSQNFTNSFITIESKEKFELSPFQIIIGYKYGF